MTKVLIIYENTGAGHQRVAKIFEQMLANESDYEVTSIAGSDLFNDVGAKIVNRLWSYLLRHDLVSLADLLVNFVFRIFALPIVEVLQTNQYRKVLTEMRPDFIVCTADGFGKLLAGYASDHDIPFVLVNTEATVFQDLANPYATHICYFRETTDAVQSLPFTTTYYTQHLNETTTALQKVSFVWRMLREHGLPGRWKSIYRLPDVDSPRLNSARCHAIGPIVSSPHFERKDRQVMRQKHAIPQDQHCVLIASGSLGGKLLHRVLDTLMQNCQTSLTVIALCGHDATALKHAQAAASRESPVDVLPLGFVDYVDELIAATDVVIARPSAGIFVESLVHRVPIILPARATTNDLGAVNLVRQAQLGCVYNDVQEIPELLQKLLSDRPAFAGRIADFLSGYPDSHDALEQKILQIIQDQIHRDHSDRHHSETDHSEVATEA